MATRKNAKFLTPSERENFVRACVMMKAEIVNPAAPAAQQYSRWDEYVAVHYMIQNAFAPGDPAVNFGHGGSGSFSFLSWHRYFLYRFELQLQSYVPGVMLPYWDWTDPGTIMTNSFLGPTGTIAGEVRSGYFARNAPGTPGNVTPAPAWWPAGLTGWILPTAFGTWAGALRRNIGNVAQLPTATDLREALAKTTYPAFQNATESGQGITNFPSQQMHNGMHGWIGGHMGNPVASPFDPIFYLHHCNIDRLWAMWQMDGHADEYPAVGGQDNHRRNDIMYPWTGGAAGYGTYVSIGTIAMPNFNALGAQRNVDTLDFRNAFGYTYDTLAVIGVGLDATGSMNAMTPDPMTTSAPDVTKWEAAKRGVSAFLQDCETVQNSGITYVMAGIKTFRRLGISNDFQPVFPAPGYGLVKTGSTFSRAAFDSNISGTSPAGSTPLADALQDVQNTLVEPPFGHVPADEQRYLAMLTDGVLTAGAPLSSIPNGSYGQTAIFAMGFGTGADVDYVTLAGIVAKGKTLTTPQVFHGENAGTIDKFYSNALAQSIGFTTVIDPVLELFAGEHAHLDFQATSADDMFLITVQGMDYDDDNWTFHLEGPGGYMAYGNGMGHAHASSSTHNGCLPDVTATRANGRLSLVLLRNNTDASGWVGTWRLMVAYKALRLDAMVMPSIDEMLFPVSAGPIRGRRFSRLLSDPLARVPTRNIVSKQANRLDLRTAGTNRSGNMACDAVVNIYARSRLRLDLTVEPPITTVGNSFKVVIANTVLVGKAAADRTYARLVEPAVDVGQVVSRLKLSDIPKAALLKGSTSLRFDPAKVLGFLEKKNARLGQIRDREVNVVSHDGGPGHVHVEKPEIAGIYHLGVYVEGSYCEEQGAQPTDHNHVHGGMNAAAMSSGTQDCAYQPFTRLLYVSVPIVSELKVKATRRRTTKKQSKRGRK